MTQPYSLPALNPLERLQAKDGLLINAERWSKVQQYHRLRQNLHFQSLHHPGIVSGLGVKVITDTTAGVDRRFQDGRSVQIQPGMALDIFGNPVILPTPENFQINVEVGEEPLLVYLVVSYVDPDDMRTGNRIFVQETYRIDLRTSPPAEHEIEVCRVLLRPGTLQLNHPPDVFFPGYNDLNFNFRQAAEIRNRAVVRLAQIIHPDPDHARNFFNLAFLMRAVEVLYSPLAGSADIGQVSLQPQREDTLAAYDVLYLTGKQTLTLEDSEKQTLAQYLQKGGLLWVDIAPDGTALADSVRRLAEELGIRLEPLERLRRNHPLRTQPFLFAALPPVNQQPIRMENGGAMVLTSGDIVSACGLDEALALPRTVIRNTQELGINILHYAWRRRSLIQLQSSS